MTDWAEVWKLIQDSKFTIEQKTDLSAIIVAIFCGDGAATKDFEDESPFFFGNPKLKKEKKPKLYDWVIGKATGKLKKISGIEYIDGRLRFSFFSPQNDWAWESQIRPATREEMFKPGALVWFGKDKKFLQTKLERVEDGVVYFEAFDWVGRNIERSITDTNLKLIEPAPQ